MYASQVHTSSSFRMHTHVTYTHACMHACVHTCACTHAHTYTLLFEDGKLTGLKVDIAQHEQDIFLPSAIVLRHFSWDLDFTLLQS